MKPSKMLKYSLAPAPIAMPLRTTWRRVGYGTKLWIGSYTPAFRIMIRKA
jgi:hypothetical protein